MDPEGQPTSELDRAVASTRTAEGIHAVTVTDDWNTPNGTPNGGYVLGLVLQRHRPGVPAARSALGVDHLLPSAGDR